MGTENQPQPTQTQPGQPSIQQDNSQKSGRPATRRIVRIAVWIIIGVAVGYLSSNITIRNEITGDYCAVRDTGFPFKTEKDWAYQYNSEYVPSSDARSLFPIAHAQGNVNTELGPVLAECGWYNDLETNYEVSRYLNMLVFAALFVMVDLLATKKKSYLVYILDPVGIFLLYIVSVVT